MAKLASRSVLGCGEAYLIGEIALGAMVGQVKRAYMGTCYHYLLAYWPFLNIYRVCASDFFIFCQ